MQNTWDNVTYNLISTMEDGLRIKMFAWSSRLKAHHKLYILIHHLPICATVFLNEDRYEHDPSCIRLDIFLFFFLQTIHIV